VPYDVVPGVPAFAAAAASLKRELTVPGVAQTVVLTRTSARSTPMPPGETLAAYAATGATLVLHLAVQRMAELAPELAAHYGADCPVAVVARASRDDELVLRGTLAGIAQQVRDAGVRRTAVVVVGRALTAGQFPDSHLYSTTRSRT
jgi:precorrin-4/cobalt-precorrin-4 C11-methyltransferase